MIKIEAKIASIVSLADGKYLYNICQTIITHKNNISRHKKRCKVNKTEHTYACDKSFLYKLKLKRPMESHNTNNQVNMCSKCVKTYLHADHYEKHVNKCTSVFPAMANCSDTETTEHNMKTFPLPSQAFQIESSPIT